jgi:hypothetical protein
MNWWWKWQIGKSPNYARRPIIDWLTPEGRVKVGIVVGCLVYLLFFFVWVSQ